MADRKSRFGFFEAISIVALIVAVLALLYSIKTRQDALSEVSVEERNSLTSPVLDEKTGNWSFVAIFEMSFTNEGTRNVTVERIAKSVEGAGFLVPLKQGEILNKDIDYSTYLVEPTIKAIRANPRLLRSIKQNVMSEDTKLDLTIKPGETKILRLGVTLAPYDSEHRNLADMVLFSYKMKFSNGKWRIFRRGAAIPPVAGRP